MTFAISPGMAKAWTSANRPKATPADIAMLEASIGTALPASYVEFVIRCGFVTFGDDVDRTCLFSYAVEKGGPREIREYEISFL